MKLLDLKKELLSKIASYDFILKEFPNAESFANEYCDYCDCNHDFLCMSTLDEGQIQIQFFDSTAIKKANTHLFAQDDDGENLLYLPIYKFLFKKEIIEILCSEKPIVIAELNDDEKCKFIDSETTKSFTKEVESLMITELLEFVKENEYRDALVFDKNTIPKRLKSLSAFM